MKEKISPYKKYIQAKKSKTPEYKEKKLANWNVWFQHEENKEHKRAYWSKWYQENKEKRRIWEKEYRLRQKTTPEKKKEYLKYRNGILVEHRSRVKRRWKVMPTYTKVQTKIDELTAYMKETNFEGAIDVRYWNMLYPRLEACKLIVEDWKKEKEGVHGPPPVID